MKVGYESSSETATAALVLPSLEKIVLLRVSFCRLTGSLETAADAPPGLLYAVRDSCLPIPEAFLLGSWINLILLWGRVTAERWNIPQWCQIEGV